MKATIRAILGLFGNSYNEGVKAGYQMALDRLRAAHTMVYDEVMSADKREGKLQLQHMLGMMDTIEAVTGDLSEYYKKHLENL